MDHDPNSANLLPLDRAQRLQYLRLRHQARKEEHNMQTVTTSRKTPTRKSTTTAIKTAVKVKTRKPVKSEERQDSYATRGQSGPRLDARQIDLNQNELIVLTQLQLASLDRTNTMTLRQIAEACFPSLEAKQAHSWVRNSLRRLVCGRLVEKVDRGTYRANTIKVPAKKSR